MNFKAAIVAGALAAGMIIPGTASAATYLSQAAFNAAHPGATTLSFNGLTTGINHVSSPYNQGGFTFSAPNLAQVSTNFWGSVDSLLSDTFNSYLDVSFAPLSDIGFFVAGGYGNSPISISFYNGANLLFSDTPTVGGVTSAFTFYGIDGIGPITRMRLDSANVGGGFASIGTISYNGGTGAVPEPATWAMMLAGFGLIGLAMRRRNYALKVKYA